MSAASSAAEAVPPYLRSLNRAQRVAVEYGVADGTIPGPLLIIAGAGTGKTNTLAHRVAHLVLNGARPDRILLLTFSRRAAAEMTRRADRILGEASAVGRKGARGSVGEIGWAGTFHGIANRLLRLHADAIGLNPAFTVLDRPGASLRFFRTQQHRHGDGHVQAPRTRFIADHLLELFDRRAWPEGASDETPIRGVARVDVAARLRDMWQ
ncbi:MAG TPA: UvrD-helicase domain-containing protein [Acetobacteraceae bacterium]|nr:UvrD-helicase domain-containing protein [Acetobacteraceae bacterium]